MPRVSEAHRVARRAEIIDAAYGVSPVRATSAHRWPTSSLNPAVGRCHLRLLQRKTTVARRGRRPRPQRSAYCTDRWRRVCGGEEPGDVAAGIMRTLAEDLHTLAGDDYGRAILQVWAEATIDPRSANSPNLSSAGYSGRSPAHSWNAPKPTRACFPPELPTFTPGRPDTRRWCSAWSKASSCSSLCATTSTSMPTLQPQPRCCEARVNLCGFEPGIRPRIHTIDPWFRR